MSSVLATAAIASPSFGASGFRGVANRGAAPLCVGQLVEDVSNFIAARVPEHEASNRRYLTVAVGCTGGQHRSVYIVEALARRFASGAHAVTTRHSGLPEIVSLQPGTGAARA